MRTVVVLLMLSFIPFSVYSEEKPRVTVVMKDGRKIDFKLDAITDKQIIGLERFTLNKVTLQRENVVSISRNRDFSDRFKTGQEGLVLTDGTVILGRITGMDEENFYVELPDKKKPEAVRRDTVEFIQFPKPAKVVEKPILEGRTAHVIVPASMQWVDTGLDLSKGEKMWFTVSSQEMIRCSAEAPTVNADGAHPFWLDEKRPLPDIKACALIARIGDGNPFFVGLQETPIPSTAAGRLYLGINDYDFRDNSGQWNVYIRTEK